jgi:hypothetical protein
VCVRVYEQKRVSKCIQKSGGGKFFGGSGRGGEGFAASKDIRTIPESRCVSSRDQPQLRRRSNNEELSKWEAGSGKREAGSGKSDDNLYCMVC